MDDLIKLKYINFRWIHPSKWTQCLYYVYIIPKELGLCHMLKFSNPNTFATYGTILWYFELTVIDLTEFIVLNIKGLRHGAAKIKGLENQSLWKRGNSFNDIWQFCYVCI